MAIPINIKSNNLDTQDNKNVGIKLPLQNSLDGSGYFEPTKLTFDAIKQNINALIKTSQGERVFHLKPKFEIKKREKIEISRYKVQTPQNIKFYNSYYNEVINGRAKTILINTCFPLGWDNTDSETEV